MNRQNWSTRLIIRYTLLQIPGIALVVIVLLLLQLWVELPAWLSWGLILFWVVKDIVLFPITWRAYDWEHKGGTAHSLIGLRGIAKERLSPAGYVQVRGERWQAEVVGDRASVEKGEAVRVRSVRGLMLLVEPYKGEGGIES